MSYIRRLPTGKWQATVRGPDGRKHTKTDPLKKVVSTWATEQESKFGKGDVRDPRAGDVRVGDWHARYAAAHAGEAITAPQNASLWAMHCEPKWATLAHVGGHPHGGAGVGRRAARDRLARTAGVRQRTTTCRCCRPRPSQRPCTSCRRCSARR